MQALPCRRWLTGASGGSEGDREGLGQSSQVLPQGGDADRGVNQMLQYPLLAFLEVGRRKKRILAAALLGKPQKVAIKDCCSNLNVGRGASREGRVDEA